MSEIRDTDDQKQTGDRKQAGDRKQTGDRKQLGDTKQMNETTRTHETRANNARGDTRANGDSQNVSAFAGKPGPGRVPGADYDAVDPVITDLIEAESERQERKLIFIASESICPAAVRHVMATPLSNIYAEGYPAPRMNVLTAPELESFDDAFVNFKRYSDRRYYKGTDYMNVIEAIAKRRAADLYANERVCAAEVFANVQSLSGAAANNAVYQAFLENGDRILGMSLVSGGHLTHGSPVNRSGRTYEVFSYSVGRDGKLDYDQIADQAAACKPKLIVAGFSAYPWDIDWEALRYAADKVGAILMADISHTSGLVAAGAVNSPVGFADVITFTTHKTLCGPRGAVILTTDEQRAKAVDLAVFPGEQGGPHMHQIAAKAVAFKLAAEPAFKTLMHDVVKNAAAMAESFKKRGFTLAYGGTDTHLFLLNLRKVKTPSKEPLTGEIASRVLDMVGVTCNKNTIAGDTSAAHPSGLRFGTTWVTQRGLDGRDLDRVAELVSKVLDNLHAYTYFYSGGAVGRAKLDFDLMEEAQAGIDEIVRKAGDTTADWEKPYPHYILETEAQKSYGRPTPIARTASQDTTNAANTGVSFVEIQGRKMVAHYGDGDAEKAAAQNGAALFDLGDTVVCRVSGRRAALFLQSATTCDALTLKPGQAVCGLVLGAAGELYTDIIVLKENPRQTSRAWSDAFLCRLGPLGRPARALRWLRDLSDGYLYHDADIYLKAEGPAVVTAVHGPNDTPWTALALSGPQGAVTLKKALDMPPPKPDQFTHWQHNGLEAVVATLCGPTASNPAAQEFPKKQSGENHPPPVFEFYCPAASAPGLWGRLLEAGAQPCGRGTLTAAQKAQKFPVSPDPVDAAAVLSSPLARNIALAKPFFVGQKALLSLIKERKPAAFDVVAHPRPAAPQNAEPQKLKSQNLEPISAAIWKKALDVAGADNAKTCLYAEHLKLTKKRNIVSFAGWQMPVWYDSIITEHEAVRRAAGLFDVAHMGVLSFTGPQAERFLDLVTANYVPWLNPGQCHYSYLLDPEGQPIDDIIVYRETRDRFMMVVNAANAEIDEAWLRALAEGRIPVDPDCPLRTIEGQVDIRNMKTDSTLGENQRVDLAFQGDAALPVLQELMEDSAQKRALAALESFHLMPIDVQGIRLIAARTGYTGEAVGFELFPHPEHAPKLWNLILEAGEKYGVRPTGLGARDSTRAEAGFPLHGHELAGPHRINPIEAGYAPFVRLHKPYFMGRPAALKAYKNWKRHVVRFQSTTQGGPKILPGSPVVDGRRGRCVGTVTSCVIVDRYQVGQAIVDRRKVDVGKSIQVFPIPASKKRGPTPKAPTDLEPGETTALPQECVVISRFMRPGETRQSALHEAQNG
jgi:glycine cleavage system T protein